MKTFHNPHNIIIKKSVFEKGLILLTVISIGMNSSPILFKYLKRRAIV